MDACDEAMYRCMMYVVIRACGVIPCMENVVLQELTKTTAATWLRHAWLSAGWCLCFAGSGSYRGKRKSSVISQGQRE